MSQISQISKIAKIAKFRKFRKLRFLPCPTGAALRNSDQPYALPLNPLPSQLLGGGTDKVARLSLSWG